MNKGFYHYEWMQAIKDGNLTYAKSMKSKYRELVMKEIIKPYHFYIDTMRQYPLINLN